MEAGCWIIDNAPALRALWRSVTASEEKYVDRYIDEEQIINKVDGTSEKENIISR